LNNPTATKEAITTDGWLKTGDVFTRDADGFYHVVDRMKEIIKYKVWRLPSFDHPIRQFEFSDAYFSFRA
jgi:acyl-coenzyme A synthetase/AMP-(fatty) acid ligase